MHIATIDYEVFWSSDHTLTKMSTMAYVMHPESEIISCAVKLNEGPTEVYFGETDIRSALNDIDWSVTAQLSHNVAFDSLITSWRLGIKPAFWFDTLSMARPIHSITVGGSLGKLVAHYNLGVKDQTALMNTKGRHLCDFTQQEIKDMGEYNKADVDQCYALFHKLKPHYSAKELWHIDATIRMLVEPKFDVNTSMLHAALSMERDQKLKSILLLARHLRKAGLASDGVTSAETMEELEEAVRAELASATKFSKMLEIIGVAVPVKPSPSVEGTFIPALAKTDEGFIALQEHENELVATAARARLAVKSTILETRLQAFIDVAGLTNGKMPIPLNYCGAVTTGRWSGWAYNPQNMPRVTPGKPKVSDALRNCLRAAPGYKVVVADLSGIELRVNHFLWKVPESMALYQKDAQADLYKAFAAVRYGIPEDEVTKAQRQLAKICQLGLGFGAGWATFKKVAKIMGGIDLTDEEAEAVTTAWRTQYIEIVQGWRSCHARLQDIRDGAETECDPWGLTVTCAEGIRLPSGRVIRYPGLHTEKDAKGRDEWWYGTGRHRARIYAGKVTENCIAGGTLVLSKRGWVDIADVTRYDLIHDGVEFVRISGLASKGVQSCLRVDGVWMTPDHEVLTNEGWTSALESPRPFRPDIRGVDNIELGGFGWTSEPMAVSLRLWVANRKGWGRGDQGGKARGAPKLRVYDPAVDRRRESSARYVQTSGVRGLPQHDRPVPVTVAPVMEKLRRAWDRGMRSVAARVQFLLGGYGGLLCSGVGLGQAGQRGPILSRELPMGVAPNQHHEQENHGVNSRHSGDQSPHGDRQNDPIQPSEIRVASGQTGHSAVTEKQVFDIINCGPRRRFVVMGSGGPFIVHNCVQALARDIVADNAFDVFRATGYRPQLSVHDELVYVAHANEAQSLLDTVQSTMRTPPKWWPQLVTWSEGDVADTYGAAK